MKGDKISEETAEYLFDQFEKEEFKPYLNKIKIKEKRGEIKGEKRGIKKGEKKGEERKSKEIAVNLLKKGMDINFIVEVTGLKVKEIKELKGILNK